MKQTKGILVVCNQVEELQRDGSTFGHMIEDVPLMDLSTGSNAEAVQCSWLHCAIQCSLMRAKKVASRTEEVMLGINQALALPASSILNQVSKLCLNHYSNHGHSI